MLTATMIAILRGEEDPPRELARLSSGVRNTQTEDRELLVAAIEACVRSHEQAHRTVAGGLFITSPGGYDFGLVGVRIFAVGPVPDERLRHCYVGAELPDVHVTAAEPSQGYPMDALLTWGIPLEVSKALTGRVRT